MITSGRDIEMIRKRGIALLAGAGWLVTASLAVMSFTLGHNALIAAGLSALLNLLPTIFALRGTVCRPARLAIGVVGAAQPALLLFALEGSPLQADSHLAVLAAITALTILCDIRPVLLAAALLIVHHAVFALAAPEYVLPGETSFGQVLLHAGAIASVAAMLCSLGRGYTRMLIRRENARQLAARQAEELAATTRSLEQALAKVEAEREEGIRAREDARQARIRDHAAMLGEFDRSIRGVMHSVLGTSQLLERTAHELNLISTAAGEEASEVARSAETASKAASTVARGVAELSSSIANIAINVGQQSELTAQATRRSEGGGEAVGTLSERSRTIGEATSAIVRIAQKTNLLSLNAAIEAASAGEAGRGFTIVAQEVKALANQASEAATEIDRFLNGVRSGTVEAEKSFTAIDMVVAELNAAATAISYDVERQRKSADTIQDFTRNAAVEVGEMVARTRSLADRSVAARKLSAELDQAAATLSANVRNLEQSSANFTRRLTAG